MGNHQYGNFSLIIRQMLEFAVDSEIVRSNEFLKVKVDKKRVLTPERKKADHTQVFNKTEELQIIRHAWDVYESGRNYVQRFVPLGIVFMFYTGLRVSELYALKFSDIEYFLIDDTYGFTGDYKAPRNGNDVIITPKRFLNEFKNLSDKKKKWCHIIL